MIPPAALAPRLADYLPRQRWFGAKDTTIEAVRIRSTEVLSPAGEWPVLLRADAEVEVAGRDPAPASSARYQVFLGLRPTGVDVEFLSGHEGAVLGEFDTTLGTALVYDALLDPELALGLLRLVAPDQTAQRVRSLGAEQSNTSLVYDDALILKVFRRLTAGANPEVEMIETLARVGFAGVPEQLGSLRRDEFDLALLQRFLAGATDGWNMALTSLRELFADGTDPADARGDFAAESERIGEVTAELHLALAKGFGTTKVSGADWADVMEDQVDRALPPGAAGGSGVSPETAGGSGVSPETTSPGDGARRDGARRIIARLREVADPGPAIRVHGDYHLAQVLCSDSGWFVLDFEGEPARPLAERTRPSSPLKDVAGMLRSLSYAPAVALSYQEDTIFSAATPGPPGFSGDTLPPPGADLARAWEKRNREHFLAGYLRRAQHDPDPAGEPILPEDPAVRSAVLAAFELDKALYELSYERANRPGWARIPLEAVSRLTGAPARAGG